MTAASIKQIINIVNYPNQCARHISIASRIIIRHAVSIISPLVSVVGDKQQGLKPSQETITTSLFPSEPENKLPKTNKQKVIPANLKLYVGIIVLARLMILNTQYHCQHNY